MRDRNFKLIRSDCRDAKLFELGKDPNEKNDLLALARMTEGQTIAYGSLRASMSALTRCRIR